jgi:hypothetical protein
MGNPGRCVMDLACDIRGVNDEIAGETGEHPHKPHIQKTPL